MLVMASCRPMGDDLLSYGQYDLQAYDETGSSHAKTFKALWTAMNENYCIWDYEAEHGLDWDEVYREYLPKFEALDDTTRQENPTDAELSKLYSSFLDSLHDGHAAIEIKMNYMAKPLTFVPSMVRAMRERGEEYDGCRPSKRYIHRSANRYYLSDRCRLCVQQRERPAGRFRFSRRFGNRVPPGGALGNSYRGSVLLQFYQPNKAVYGHSRQPV